LAKILFQTEATFIFHVSLTGILKQFLYKIKPLDGARISVFSKMSGPTPGPTLVLSDWIEDKAAGDERSPSYLSSAYSNCTSASIYSYASTPTSS